ncbi:MAG TPA: LysM peptidoglycan-binding domain-containing protein [Acidimicrobiales bacterium]|nr:LysM peptidoglycan-binding domain-containing protein [Acidimicrobiales bacterium]
MAAITIDSPRWLDGWGEPLSTPRPPQPSLALVGGGRRRPDPALLRRRRATVLLVAVALVLAALAVGTLALSRPATAGELPAGRPVHVVQPGESYWSIADRYADGGDLRLAVDALIDLNGARPLFPGDTIELP